MRCSVRVVRLAALGMGMAACGGDRQPGKAAEGGPPALAPTAGPGRPAPAHGTFRATPAPAPAGAFAPDAALFPPQGTPGMFDWRAVHREATQSFEEYVQDAPTRPNATRRTIVLQPLGPFSPDERALLDVLCDYLGVYFQLDARIADPLPLPALGTRTQKDGDRTWVQYRTDILLYQVLGPRLPKDAVAYLGITTADLFPDPAWNYVFGVGNLNKRVGVYSLARLGPAFGGEPDTAETRARTLRRALAVLAHETGHMFSLRHCQAGACLMNGANSLDELDRATPWLCPACLRKLHYDTGFDIRRHYEELRAFYSARSWSEPTAWLERRLATLGH